MMQHSRTASASRFCARAPLALAIACGLAAPTNPAAAQLSEPFPAVFELSSLTPAAGGDGSLGFIVDPGCGPSVASAGDVNGDGIDDVIVGGRRELGTDFRLSWVVFGSAGGFPPAIDPSDLDGSNGFRLRSGARDNAGFSVSGAGDINGDGVDDIIVGVPGPGVFGGPRPVAYIVYGRASGGFAAEIDLAALDGADGFRVDSSGDRFVQAFAVSRAGDVNGDGVDDVVIGLAHDPGSSATAPHRAYLLFGRQGGGFDPLVDLAGLDGTDGFRVDGGVGSAVAGAGDINGDGIGDIVLGVPGDYDYYAMGYGCGCAGPGEAYVVFGRTQFGPSIDVRSLNGADGFRLAGFGEAMAGLSVAPAGDFNSDGIDDVIIGAPGLFGVTSRAFIVFGRDITSGAGFPPFMSLTALGAGGVSLEGHSAAGASVAGVGDINGDGVDDVVIGAPYFEFPLGLGGSYVVYGSAAPESKYLPDLDGEDGFQLPGAGGGWVLEDNGQGVAAAGDVNGDGRADLILAWPGRAAFVVFGRIPDTPCYADCDGSGSLDFFDFLCFQNLFATGDPRADCDESGELDFFDFLCFQNAFAEGCP